MPKTYPKISFIIPTLNAAKVLESALVSIDSQDYPKDCVELIVVDAGSNDATLEIARKYGAKIVHNPYKTSEGGKMVGLHEALGDYIVFVDSDNVITYNTWLYEMIEPLEADSTVVCSEPIEYTWRKEDGFITRYCALIGMNDPFVLFLGKYDRMNLLSGKWTEVAHKEVDCGHYLVAEFDTRGVPTVGANGAVFKKEFLQRYSDGDYLFDIDTLARAIADVGSVKIIKVKNGIVHTYCERSITKFLKKQARRVRDFVYNKSVGRRKYSWAGKNDIFGYLKFIIYCVLVFPLFVQTFVGFSRKRDWAWFFHPLACELTLFQYAVGTITSLFKKAEMSREGWSQ